MKIYQDEKAKYLCPKCGCKVFKAEDEDGKRIFVHRTCNGYADHAKNCPLRRPDIIVEESAKLPEIDTDIFQEEIIITKPEIINVSAKDFKKYAKSKTTPKKANEKKGTGRKKVITKKPSKAKNKTSKKSLPANKRTTTRRSKSA